MDTINILAPINTLGYGVVGTNVTLALSELGYEPVLFPIGKIEESAIATQNMASQIGAAIAREADWNPKNPGLKIWHEFALADTVGQPRIAFPFFEINAFDKRRKNHLSGQDLVLVASEWGKQVIDTECPNLPCEVVELGVNRQIFRENDQPHNESKPFVFLNVGKFSINKGHDVLAESFNNAFEEKDNVELWLCAENPFCTDSETKEWHQLFKQSKLGAKIRIFPRLQSQLQLAAVMQEADCGIFLSRGEAWNLEILEMMSCGLPSIVTNYGGHTQFCNDQNSFLVPISALEPAYDGKFFLGECGEWANFDNDGIGCVVDHLRNIYRNSLSLTKKTKCLETATTLSWLNTGQKIVNAIDTIK
jgi:glycosyltransferase involved in cell wall biosynthesis